MKPPANHSRRRTLARSAMPVLTAAALAVPATARSDVVDHAERYRDCMATIETDAEAAFEKGLTWQGLGGGAASEHCIGAALFALGRYKQAAVRLEDLAQRAVVETHIKAEILTQAARAWLHVGDLDHADDVISTAIQLLPDRSGLYVHRAEIAAAAERFSDAIDDLDHALTLDPDNVDALAFRASALRQTGQTEHALRDAENALVRAPNHPEALLEFGMASRVLGNDGDARKAWLRVLDVEPDGPTADLARRNLELMDVKPDGG